MKNNIFYPYKDSTLDTPSAHFILKPCLPYIYPLIRILYPIRWLLSQPLQIRLLPKWFPLVPGLKSLAYITIGQVLLSFPLIILLFVGYNQTFITPSLDQSGYIASFALVFAFLTANKSNSVISFFFGISFERMIFYHNISSLVALILSLFHTYVAFVYGEGSDNSRNRRLSSDDSQYTLSGGNPNFILFCFDGATNTSGSAIIIFMLLLIGTSSFPILRRWLFEFWLITHVVSAIGVIVFCVIHSATSVFFVGVWWAFDVFMRYVIMALMKYPTKAKLSMVLADVVEIRFPKQPDFHYRAGQFVQIAVPMLSPIEFHPITISSAPHESDVTLHIRALGGWSRKLRELSESQKEITIFLEGPYGCLSVDLDNDQKYQMILMVSGGIGVTPCQSIARSLLRDFQEGRKLHKVRFIWAVQDINMAIAISPPTIGDTSVAEINQSSNVVEVEDAEVPSEPHLGNLLQTDVYVTKSVEADVEENNAFATPFHVHTGRPKLDNIFVEIKEEAIKYGLTHVAVVSCGPTAMLEEVRRACRKYSLNEFQCGGVRFDLHEEMFEF